MTVAPACRIVRDPRRGPGGRPDVLILGAGIIGLACAWELARWQVRVTVVDRRRAGSGASTAAAGMLAPLTEVREPGPLLEACRTSRDRWASWYRELEEESGLSLDYDDSGALAVAPTGAGEGLAGLAAAAEAAGDPAQEVDEAWLRRQVPDLAPGLGRALLLPGEHRVDNVKAVAALALAAEARGARIESERTVERVDLTGGGVRVEGPGWRRDAGLLVLAAGAWSGDVPGLPPLPVRPVRGQMLLLGGVRWPWKGIVRGGGVYAVRRGETGLLIGATSEEVGFDASVTAGGIGELLARTREVLPGLDPCPLEATWAGLRPGTADGLPLVGPVGELPVIAATGHYRNGILLAPWTARQVAATVLEGELPAEARAFSPLRLEALADLGRRA